LRHVPSYVATTAPCTKGSAYRRRDIFAPLGNPLIRRL
jgi:hypothetical protein